MLQTVGDDAKRQSFGFRKRFLTVSSVGYNARKLRYLRNPPSVLFTFEFDSHILLSRGRIHAVSLSVRMPTLRLLSPPPRLQLRLILPRG